MQFLVTERAKLYFRNPRSAIRNLRSAVRDPRSAVVAALLLATTVITGCVSEQDARIYGVYAHDSRLLLRLDYDYNGDGRIDVRTYIREGRPVRLEGDSNADGLIDRWEYYAPSGQLRRIGASSEGDGIEDTWTLSDGEQRQIELSTARDGMVDRREFYQGDALLRAESDTNRDGLPDRWEEFRDGVLERLLLDDELRLGRPTRRLIYKGDVVHVETDADGDGRFERVAHEVEPTVHEGGGATH